MDGWRGPDAGHARVFSAGTYVTLRVSSLCSEAATNFRASGVASLPGYAGA
jgi:hypothetical protein